MNTEQLYLVRFARGRFTHFDASRGLSAGAYTIYEDPSGELFIGTDRGLGRIERDRFVPVSPDVIHGKALGIVRRRDGSLWVATDTAGVFRVVDGRAERLPVAPAFGRDSAFSVFEDPEERLWIGAEDRVWEVPKGALEGIPSVGPSPGDITRFVYLPTTRAVLGYGLHHTPVDPHRPGVQVAPGKSPLREAGGGGLNCRVLLGPERRVGIYPRASDGRDQARPDRDRKRRGRHSAEHDGVAGRLIERSSVAP